MNKGLFDVEPPVGTIELEIGSCSQRRFICGGASVGGFAVEEVVQPVAVGGAGCGI